METLLLSVAGSIILLLLGANSYFMKRWIDSTDSLTNSVNALKTTVALLQGNQGNSERICSSKHDVIDKRLNAHSERLNEHSESIAELKILTDKSRRPYVKKNPKNEE